MEIRIFGQAFELRRKALPLAPVPSSGRDGWRPLIVREPFTGAWQRNEEIRADSVLANPTVFACVTRIAQDISKLPLRLVEQTSAGIWVETTNPAYSPVLRSPNHYQLAPKFVEQWITSKLIWGNVYVLKGRDQRGVVNRLYVLDPTYVTPLVAPDGSVYYQLRRNDLAGLGLIDVTVPAREIIHDRMVCLFHPLIGVGPLFACALAAQHGLTIQQTSTSFFQNGSNPGGILLIPGAIKDETATRLKDEWNTKFTGSNAGKVALLSGGVKYETTAVNAVDSELINQLNKTEADICADFGVPMFLLDSTKGAPYANNEPILQLYFAQCLQSLITNLETSLDAGLDLATGVGTEFDIDDLIWMDTATRTKAAADAIHAGAMTPNEARKKYFGLGPVVGGDTPYMQQQMFSLAALAERDADHPFTKPAAPPAAAPAEEQAPDEPPGEEQVAALQALMRAEMERAA